MTRSGEVRITASAPQAEDADAVNVPDEVEELLVEEVSIDGMCGVY